MNNKLRIGNYSSSKIYKLCKSLKSGKPTSAFYSYIEEKLAEREMGRTSSADIKTVPIKWGSLMECILFELLGLEYDMTHEKTIVHPKYKYWVGTPDLIADIKVGEIKCFQPLHFGKLSLALLTKDTEIIKEKEPEVYWQVVSNAIILGKNKAEIIAYMPYKSELEGIIEKIIDTDFLENYNLSLLDYYFLTNEGIESLAYLPDDSKMSNINSFEFIIPQKDKDFLESRVIEAEEYLNGM